MSEITFTTKTHLSFYPKFTSIEVVTLILLTSIGLVDSFDLLNKLNELLHNNNPLIFVDAGISQNIALVLSLAFAVLILAYMGIGFAIALRKKVLNPNERELVSFVYYLVLMGVSLFTAIETLIEKDSLIETVIYNPFSFLILGKFIIGFILIRSIVMQFSGNNFQETKLTTSQATILLSSCVTAYIVTRQYYPPLISIVASYFILTSIYNFIKKTSNNRSQPKTQRHI